MQLVNFSFRPGVTEEQQALVLDRIRQWEAVIEAAPLKPEARHPSIRKMHHAYITDDADATAMAESLSNLPGVESAEVPAKRYLIE